METPLDVLSRAATLIHDQLKSAAKGGTLHFLIDNFLFSKKLSRLRRCQAVRHCATIVNSCHLCLAVKSVIFSRVLVSHDVNKLKKKNNVKNVDLLSFFPPLVSARVRPQ